MLHCKENELEEEQYDYFNEPSLEEENEVEELEDDEYYEEDEREYCD